MIEALNNEFEVLSEVGRGGMGVVYKARQISLDRIVAIKMLLREFARDDDFINRFKREARAVGALKHPNIVDIYDIREAGGTWFIITEFVDGGTLRDLLRRSKVLQENESTRILYDTCAALFYTHKKGIIHRDIKPDNIMFTEDRRVKVTDFGLARLSDSSFQTRTGLSMGTPRYMAPEQASGKPTDHRSDIYALGVMVFEMVTGRVPFEGDNAFAVVYKHINEKPPAPSEINPQVPEWVDQVILKCLAKKPEDRFQDCESMGKALEGAVSTPARVSWSTPVSQEEPPAKSGEGTIQMTAKMAAREKPPVKRQGSSKPWPAIAGISAVLIALGVYAIFGLNPRPSGVVGAGGQETPVASGPAQGDKVVALVAEAKLLMEQGKLPESRGRLEAALQEDPTHEEAKGLLGQLGELEKQQAAIQQELEAVSELAKQGKVQEAMAEAEGLLTSHPTSIDVQNALATLKEQAKKLDQVEKLMARAKDHLANGRDNQAYSDLQDVLDLNPDHADAARLLKEVEKGVGKDEKLRQLRAQLNQALAQSDFSAAEAKANQILEASPGDAEAQNALAKAKAGMADGGAATTKASSLDDMLADAEGLLKNMRYDELISSAKSLSGEASKTTTPNGAKVRERADEFLEIAQLVPSLLSQAESGLNKRNVPGVQSAIKSCEEALKLNPADTVAARMLSMATQQLADLQTSLDAAVAQSQKLYQKLDLEGAMAQIEKALEIQPDQQAAKALAQEIEGKLDEVTSRRIQGTTWFSQREYGKARKEFEAILKLIPGDTEAAQMLAKCDEAIEKGGSTAKPPEPELPQPQPVQPVSPAQPQPQAPSPQGVVAEYAPAGAIGTSGQGQLQSPADVFVTESATYVVDETRCQVVKFSPQGEYVTAFGTKSKALNPLGGDLPNGEFARPCSVAADRDESIYVLDSRGRCVQKFDKDGNFLLKWGGRGDGRGGFDTPVGLTVGSDGSVFVVDSKQCRIQKFSFGGQFVSEWGSRGTYTKELMDPTDICADWEGNLYVTDTGNARIQKYNLDGSYITQFALKDEGTSKHQPIGVAADSDNSIYIVDAAPCNVQKFTKLCKFVVVLGAKGGASGQLKDPRGVAVSPSGSVFVANAGNARVEKYGPARK